MNDIRDIGALPDNSFRFSGGVLDEVLLEAVKQSGLRRCDECGYIGAEQCVQQVAVGVTGSASLCGSCQSELERAQRLFTRMQARGGVQ